MRLLVFPGLLQPAVMDIMHAGPANVRDEEREKKYKIKIKEGKNSKNERAEAPNTYTSCGLGQEGCPRGKKEAEEQSPFLKQIEFSLMIFFF